MFYIHRKLAIALGKERSLTMQKALYLGWKCQTITSQSSGLPQRIVDLFPSFITWVQLTFTEYFCVGLVQEIGKPKSNSMFLSSTMFTELVNQIKEEWKRSKGKTRLKRHRSLTLPSVPPDSSLVLTILRCCGVFLFEKIWSTVPVTTGKKYNLTLKGVCLPVV